MTSSATTVICCTELTCDGVTSRPSLVSWDTPCAGNVHRLRRVSGDTPRSRSARVSQRLLEDTPGTLPCELALGVVPRDGPRKDLRHPHAAQGRFETVPGKRLQSAGIARSKMRDGAPRRYSVPHVPPDDANHMHSMTNGNAFRNTVRTAVPRDGFPMVLWRWPCRHFRERGKCARHVCRCAECIACCGMGASAPDGRKAPADWWTDACASSTPR
jgi:hypothetical protein